MSFFFMSFSSDYSLFSAFIISLTYFFFFDVMFFFFLFCNVFLLCHFSILQFITGILHRLVSILNTSISGSISFLFLYVFCLLLHHKTCDITVESSNTHGFCFIFFLPCLITDHGSIEKEIDSISAVAPQSSPPLLPPSSGQDYMC